LPAGEVHLWKAAADAGPRDEGVLSEDERTRAARFKYEHDRERWVAGRALLRRVLGRYLATPPGSVGLEAGARGRPAIAWPEGSGWLSFSPSRSGDVALVAVARDVRIGVDVERIRPDLDVLPIARRVLGDDAARGLADAADDERISAFFREWVREEARGKCRGTGLVEPDDPARLVPLRVADFEVADGYAAALAVDGVLGVVRGCVAPF
jgi:4'-phosphopantetheinyl transferase